MSAMPKKLVAVASLEALFKPHSIAVIGASRRPATIGNKLFHNLLHQEFKGVVYPVNPNTEAVASVKTYSSVLEIPGSVDMAIVITPAETVQKIVEECGQKGVRIVIVISAGFGEIGVEGLKKQDKILTVARRYGMRLIGPNCMGVINTDPEINMNATFSSVFPPAGNISFGTQSGALGLAILEYAKNLNIGLSSFVSIGNRADVSSNDLLQYWRDDPNTNVILLYLESFGNPRKFARMARSITSVKPVLAVKSGRTPAGSKAAASHTGALATTEVAAEALFAQTGIIRVDTLEELFDAANLVCHQPIPSGRKVVILTNGGGPGIMTADACADRGLELPNLSDKTISEMVKFLPDRASLTNPVDMTAEATAEQYRRALEILATDDNVNIVIAIFIPPVVTDPEAVLMLLEIWPHYMILKAKHW
jgi:acetyltransferase